MNYNKNKLHKLKYKINNYKNNWTVKIKKMIKYNN